MKKHFFKITKISKKEILSRPEEDLGKNWDNGDKSVTLPHSLYFDSDPVAIKDVIEVLVEMNSKGANYISVDWNCDHRELEIMGIEFRHATPKEIDDFEKIMVEKEKNAKEYEILRLEERLQKLKEGK
jgi:hypothetical protein